MSTQLFETTYEHVLRQLAQVLRPEVVLVWSLRRNHKRSPNRSKSKVELTMQMQ